MADAQYLQVLITAHGTKYHVWLSVKEKWMRIQGSMCYFFDKVVTVSVRVFSLKFLMGGGLKIFGPRRSPTGTKSDGGGLVKKNPTEA